MNFLLFQALRKYIKQTDQELKPQFQARDLDPMEFYIYINTSHEKMKWNEIILFISNRKIINFSAI